MNEERVKNKLLLLLCFCQHPGLALWLILTMTVSLPGPGAMHDVNKAALFPPCSLCLLLTVTLLYLLKFWRTDLKFLSVWIRHRHELLVPLKKTGNRENTFLVCTFSFFSALRLIFGMGGRGVVAGGEGRLVTKGAAVLGGLFPNLFVCLKGRQEKKKWCTS